MKTIISFFTGLLVMCSVVPGFAANDFSTCGAGYVLASRAKIDGINARECVKLWCRDLETNKPMGVGARAAAGYVDRLSEVTDGRDTIECFGVRRWCTGDVAGVWAPEYGAYVRGGDDGSTYKSVLNGNCFTWRLEKPECPAGQAALLRDGEWLCVTATTGGVNNIQKSSVRRTGTMHRLSH